MSKNLVYAALGVGGVAVITTVALTKLNSDESISVAQFPVVFEGEVTKDTERYQSFSFISPTDGIFRVSFDPRQPENERDAVNRYATWISIRNLSDSTPPNTFAFFTNNIPISFCAVSNNFEYGKTYQIDINVIDERDPQNFRFALGIGLNGGNLRFDPTEYGKVLESSKTFYRYGVNYSDGYPYGYLPEAFAYAGYTNYTFKGWYTAEEGGDRVDERSIATNSISMLYAHWDFGPSFEYTIAFDGGDGADGSMTNQTLRYNFPSRLIRNRYYKPGVMFVEWTNQWGKAYANGAVVTNLFDIPFSTNTLYAVWDDLGRTNAYVVSSDVTNFTGCAISTNTPSFFDAVGGKTFCLTVTNTTNVAVRVSIDPAEGSDRIGAALLIDRLLENGEWTNGVCSRTDFATNEITYAFTNATYRFSVTNVPADYAYIVGLGLEGAAVCYNPCGEEFVFGAEPRSESLKFNWTVGSPYGHLPLLNSSTYGNFYGWFYTKDISATNRVASQDLIASGTNMVFAHWSKFPYAVRFDANDGYGAMDVQDLKYNCPEPLNANLFYRSLHRFAGWATNAGDKATAVYANCALVTNLCTTFGGKVPLYAVWNKTPGANDFIVSQAVTNFENVIISPSIKTFAHGDKGMTDFCMTLTNADNVATNVLRISLDPERGHDRKAATLIVERLVDGTNWVNKVAVSDLATNEVAYAFTNATYRFRVSADYPYVVGINLQGARIDFGPCGGAVKKTLSDSLTFDWTVDSPFGYLPTVTNAIYGTNTGWYCSKSITNNLDQIFTTNIVTGVTTAYVHWANSPYWVAFDGNGASNTNAMPAQLFQYGKGQNLNPNLYYRSLHRFVGWTNHHDRAFYVDKAMVSNLCSVVGETNALYAVWDLTPGTNEFTVAQGVTNFENVAVSKDITTLVAVPGNVQAFIMAMTNNAASELRVSLDPMLDGKSKRTDAKLYIDRWHGGTNWTNSVSWVVSDLATNEVRYAFTNATYRFRLTGVTAGYFYVVGLGREGLKIDFDPCGADIASASLSQSKTFNWSRGAPYGYLPAVPNPDAKLGTLQGWFYTNDITVTNASYKVFETNVVAAARTAYAHWSHQLYWVGFDKADPAAVGDMAVQPLYYDVVQQLNRNQYYNPEHKFKCWKDAAGKEYPDCAVVTNLCKISGETNWLHAVWQHTPGTNWYYVAGGMTNFGTIAVSQGSPTLFVGKGDTTQFYAVSANISNCRVAIDPDLGYGRTGAKLTIDSAEIPAATNKTQVLEWESACTVTDLSEKEVKCAFTTNHCYRFTISGVANTNGYVVSIGAEGARYIFDVCGGNFVGVEKPETTKVKFYNWTVGSAIAYTPPATTNAYVHGTNTWHYTPLYLTPAQEREQGIKSFSVTNLVVSGGEKLYAHWSDAVIVDLVFDWNLAATNVVFTNYYGQGATVKLYDDAYVRQPTYDNLGFLGWTTNRTGTAGYDLTSFTATTNSAKFYYAQWTDEWKTSRTSDGAGLSVDGYYKTLGAVLDIPTRVNMAGTTVEWPVNVVAIGDSAFTNCLFATLLLPRTLTRIGSVAFNGCSAFKVLNIPEGVTYLGDSAFDGCTSLTTVTFPTVEVENEYAESGFLDGVLDPDSPSVELGTCLFKGCTSLKDVELPLGVCCIPNECFSGCSAMTSFDKMPYTVTEIGTEAFYGCTHLTNIVHKEIVDKIGEGAYKKCARLKFVSFIGDNPEAVEGDIFERTPRNVLVRYLENMCETAKDYCGGSWPELPGLWPVAGDKDASRTLTWLGGKYPRRKVIFNCNDKVTLWECTQTSVLYHKDRVFGLHAPTAEDMSAYEAEMGEFSGWYTQPMGGRKVGNYWVVPTASEGDSAPITVYAHWGEETEAGETEIGSRSSEEYPVSWPGAENAKWDFDEFTGFYSADDDMFYYSASTFNGIVIDLANENAITGTVKFVFQDGTYPTDGGMQSAFTATITWNGGRTTSISGVADAEGYLVATGKRWSFGEGDDGTLITKSGIYGWLTDNNEGTTFRVYAARNRTAQATEGAARTVVLTGLQATKGTWHVVLATEAAEGEGEEFAVGYSTLSITIADMGQATITGTLGDGTAAKTSSTLIIGDGCCCLPVNIRPYGGKGGFSFLLWFTWQNDGSFGAEDASVQGVTGWDASMSTHPFTAKLTTDIGADDDLSLTFIDEKQYSGPAVFDSDGIDQLLSISGTVWKVVGDNTEHKLQLKYNGNSGIFTGSYVVDEQKATVNGVFTDRITVEGEGYDAKVTEKYHGYGTAVIKNEGSVPVEIETETLP